MIVSCGTLAARVGMRVCIPDNAATCVMPTGTPCVQGIINNVLLWMPLTDFTKDSENYRKVATTLRGKKLLCTSEERIYSDEGVKCSCSWDFVD